MNQTLVLYSNSTYSSPYVLSVYATLVEKGLPFELKTVALDGQQFGDEYASLSLTSRVPTLVAGDFSLSESSAIVEFLEDTYPAPEFTAVLPRNREPRARARQVMAWLRSDLGVLREERSTAVIFAEKNPRPLTAAGKQAADKLLRGAGHLIDEQGNNLFGAWSVADVDLAVMLNRLVANGDPVPEKFRRYVTRQWERPSMKTWWERAAEHA
ncbi:MAG TPA: glutathione transferase [Burkholderiaceae bacterium]|nr:glutathione transferase [Burkholderiaceae bacterium]